MADAQRVRSPDVYFFGFPRMGYFSLNTIPYLAQNVQAVDIVDPLGGPPTWPIAKTTWAIFLPERLDELALVQQAYPTGTYEEKHDDMEVLSATPEVVAPKVFAPKVVSAPVPYAPYAHYYAPQQGYVQAPVTPAVVQTPVHAPYAYGYAPQQGYYQAPVAPVVAPAPVPAPSHSQFHAQVSTIV